MLATHSSFGLNVLKCILTRSAEHCPPGALRVVRGDLARLDALHAQVCHEPRDGTAGDVTGIVTLGDLGSAPHYIHLTGPQHRVAGSCEPLISPS